jgi:hypothetical protein
MTADRFLEILHHCIDGKEMESDIATEYPTDYENTYQLGIYHGKLRTARFLLAKFNEYVKDKA